MKKNLKKIFTILIRTFHFFYSMRLFIKIRSYYGQFYSIWLSNEFKDLGANSSFKYPLYLHGGKRISIGENFACDHRLRLDAFEEFLEEKFNSEIIIGNNVIIQKDCHIGAINKIIIGNNVLIASKVYISDHSHGSTNKEDLLNPPVKRKLYSKGPVIIEDNVWLGEGVVVLPGVIIGKNSIIGANSVVTKSIPKNSVAVGIPARIIKSIV